MLTSAENQRIDSESEREAFRARAFLECAETCSTRWEHTESCQKAFQQITAWRKP